MPSNGNQGLSTKSSLTDSPGMMDPQMIAPISATTVVEGILGSRTIWTTFKGWDSMQFGFLLSLITMREATTAIGAEIYTA